MPFAVGPLGGLLSRTYMGQLMPAVTTGQSGALDLNLGARIRDQILQNETLIVATVNSVISRLEPHRAEFYRRRLAASKSFAASIMRVTVDIGVVITLAKALKSDDDFSSAASLLHEVDRDGHNGKVRDFAVSIVQADLADAKAADAAELIYHLVPAESIERRLNLVLAFLAQTTR